LAPHMASELLEQLFGKKLKSCTWPTFDPKLAQQTEITLVIQVNGKVRGKITCSSGSTQEQVQKDAEVVIHKWLDGKTVVKVIFVPDKLISFVVK